MGVVAVALVCVGCAMFFGAPGLSDTDTVILRVCTDVAALAAVACALLLRRWDRYAGRRISELKVKQSSMEWRAEERQAELESERDDAYEERDRLERTLGEKRAELARLRSEYAGLLRRFAHSEAELANVLEGQRKLQLEAKAPAKALDSGVTDHRERSGAPTPLTYLQANEALKKFGRNSAEHFRRLREEREQRERSERVERERREALRRREEQQERARRDWRQGQEQAAAARRAVPEQQQRSEPGTGRFDFFGGGGNKRRKRAAQQRRSPGAGQPSGDEGRTGTGSGSGPGSGSGSGSGPAAAAGSGAQSPADAGATQDEAAGAGVGEAADADSAARPAN